MYDYARNMHKIVGYTVVCILLFAYPDGLCMQKLHKKSPAPDEPERSRRKGKWMSVDWIGHAGQVAGPVTGQVSPDQVGLVLGLLFRR